MLNGAAWEDFRANVRSVKMGWTTEEVTREMLDEKSSDRY